jgi:hypothetical protein
VHIRDARANLKIFKFEIQISGCQVGKRVTWCPDVDFKNQQIIWDAVPFKPLGATIDEALCIHDSEAIVDSVDHMKKILEAKYKPADIGKLCRESTHLTAKEKESLFQLLHRFETLFDGSLGRWMGEPYDIQLQPDAKPYHAKAYPIPKFYEATLRAEVERLCRIGVLRKVNRSEWAAPTCIIPKKDGTEQRDTKKALSDTSHLRLATETRRFYVCNVT